MDVNHSNQSRVIRNMTYAILAWRDGRGDYGISIGHVEPIGFNNHVVEIELSEAELDEFLAEISKARERARSASAPMAEPMPGAYENWSSS